MVSITLGLLSRWYSAGLLDVPEPGSSASHHASTSPPSAHHINPDNVTYAADDIKTEYHPRSGRPPVVQGFDEYRRYTAKPQMPEHSEPWFPFSTRGDFEIAAFALDAGLNRSQTNTLLSLTHKFISQEHKLTLRNYDDMRSYWEAASHKLTPVSYTL